MKIQIKNFQSLKDLNLSVDGSNFITIVGDTSSGKSAFRRSLSTLLYNTWDKNFLRNDTKSMSVSLVEDNFSLSIEKPVNTYTLNGEDYRKIGSDFPADLKSKLISLGVKKFRVSDEELDILIDNQLGTMFLVEERDAMISKVFSRIFEVDKFALALTFVQKDIQNDKIKITALKNSIAECETELEGIEKKIELLYKAVRLEEKISEIKEYFEQLSISLKVQRELKQYEKEFLSLSLELKRLLDKETSSLKTKSLILKYTYDSLILSQYLYTSNLPELSLYQVRGQTLDSLKYLYDYLTISISGTKGLLAHLEQKEKVLVKLKLHEEYLFLQNKCISNKQELDKMIKQGEDLQNQISSIEVCPTCKRPL